MFFKVDFAEFFIEISSKVPILWKSINISSCLGVFIKLLLKGMEYLLLVFSYLFLVIKMGRVGNAQIEIMVIESVCNIVINVSNGLIQTFSKSVNSGLVSHIFYRLPLY